MANKDRSFQESPEKARGEGWLYSEQQQKLCHFKPDTATVHAQWVAIRAYSYVPPRPPEPMTRGGWKAPSNISGQWISESALM